MSRTTAARIGVALVAAVILTACPPPPDPNPPPPTLGGTPTFVGRQELRIFISGPGGTVDCRLHLDTVMDLGYTTVRVNSKTAAVGCASTAWTAKRAIGSCTIGTSAFSCGQLWAFNTSGTYVTRTFTFASRPHFGRIHTDFQANVTAGGAPIPIAIHGSTPEIQCSTELLQCKFQI